VASPDTTPVMTALVEPTYSAREAAALLGRSFSWLDQRIRRGDFVRFDGTVVEPLRTDGGYRYFSIEMLKDIATCCYRQRWYSLDEMKSVFRELVMAAHRDGQYKIPG
jgi:hypothetical protein